MLELLNLKTELQLPPFDLESNFLKNAENIEKWFELQWQLHTPPIYGSVDLRNSGYKLTPVDLNLYPGGFNNIHPSCNHIALDAFKKLLQQYPHIKRILLIPENHTRNLAYLENVYILNSLLEKTGLQVKMGIMSELITQITTIELSDNKNLTYHPLTKVQNKLQTTDGFIPDLIIVNNDLSSGIALLDNIQQLILPPINAGWYIRKKTNFFKAYDIVASDFANLVNIDPWRINAIFSHGKNLDFSQQLGIEELATQVDQVIQQISEKYKEHNIKEEPYVIVKANSGTYGMGIMAVKSSKDILTINRKSRNKMAVIKDGQNVNDVIIQEGVHTIDRVGEATAEPVVYMVHDSVIGGFYRTHLERGWDQNLNASGAKFVPMELLTTNNQHNRFYFYSVIARLSLLASSLEIK